MFNNVSTSKGNIVTVYFEGQAVQTEEGMTVAAAVLNPSHGWTRTSHSGKQCGPFCHMGVCHECLMTINDVPNQQACLTVVAEGMRISRQNGVPDLHRKENNDA